MLWVYGTIVSFVAIRYGAFVEALNHPASRYIKLYSNWPYGPGTAVIDHKPVSWVDALKTVLWGDFETVLLNVLIIAGLMFVWAIATELLTLWWNDRNGTEWDVEEDRYEIVTIRDNNSLKGKFVLGSGDVGGGSIFSWYQLGDDGGFFRRDVPSSQCRVYQDSIEPYVNVVVWERFSNPLAHHLLWDVSNSDDPSYKIHVPKGSIRMDVSFDAS